MSHQSIAKAVVAEYGRTYSDEIGADIARNTPSSLFLWLVGSILFSARISAGLAIRGAIALRKAGWRTPQAIRKSSWEERVEVLNESGYARYDESTARMLGEVADLMMERYDGDLRKLRKAADGDLDRLQALLKEFKGIGSVGAGIFCREVQVVWDEFYPFADKKAAAAAEKLGLPGEPEALAKLVPKAEFARLLTGLVRVDLADAYDKLRGKD